MLLRHPNGFEHFRSRQDAEFITQPFLKRSQHQIDHECTELLLANDFFKVQ